jgi:CRISPR-associated protein Csb2
MPGRAALPVQRGPKVCVPDPEVRFLWPSVQIPQSEVDALAWRAARVGYLGCADSKALLSICCRPPAEGVEAAKRWQPIPDGAATGDCVLVNVGSQAHLDAALRAHGLRDPRDRRRARQRRTRCWYRPPTVAGPVRNSGGSCVWLQFSDSLPSGATVRVAYSLKAALMRRWADHENSDPPWWVSGHGTPEGRDYQLARFLALPTVEHQYADGQLSGACVWIPEAAEANEGAMLAALSRTLGRFHVPGLGDVATSEFDPLSQRRRWAATPDRWVGPARRWVTALPALSDRHGFPSRADVVRWCVQADLPPVDDESVRVSRRRLLAGGVELKSHQVARPKHRSTRGFAHVQFVLAEPVLGPIAIGAGRSYGLGLCAPDDRSDREA